MATHSSLAFGVALVAAACGQQAATREPGPPPVCRREVIRGRVSKGEEIERPFADQLVFILEPETHPRNPQGWTIRVAPATSRELDYSMVATPPYRFRNPRYVDTGYGVTADEALAWTPRQFAFVASRRDYDSARRALEVLLWPANHTQAQVDSARQELEGLRTYPGTFWIEDGAAAPPSSDRPAGVIEWISFRVELCVPAE